jgi:hypothetical protein
MCSIIIAASKWRLMDVTGFNPLSKDAEDVRSDDMKVLDDKIVEMKDEHGNGVDRMFKFGPTCTFNGSQVPKIVTCSKTVSITSQLLTNMLSRMDDLEIFDQISGVNSFLLCNGNVSRFEEPFLEYTLASNRPWTCCTGVSYGTSMSQVVYRTEHNGTFKIESKKAKASAVRYNIRPGLPVTLHKSDVVRIVNVAWQKSFARVDTNKRAIATRGWGPLMMFI